MRLLGFGRSSPAVASFCQSPPASIKGDVGVEGAHLYEKRNEICTATSAFDAISVRCKTLSSINGPPTRLTVRSRIVSEASEQPARVRLFDAVGRVQPWGVRLLRTQLHSDSVHTQSAVTGTVHRECVRRDGRDRHVECTSCYLFALRMIQRMTGPAVPMRPCEG